ncbi:sugar phosphate nucleotidyltransferase [Paenibacillus chitinolyticus]
MKIILLSGGSGKRLWPLSNDSRSKQFLKVLKNKEGHAESMVQRVWKQLSAAGLSEEAFITTNRGQYESIVSQLGPEVPVIIEPSSRDTFPAVSLAVTYLYSELRVPDDETIVILPVDPYVENEFYEKIKELDSLLERTKSPLALIGVTPTFPSEKYGYIVPSSCQEDSFSWVDSFVEKPNVSKAEQLISQKALWNCGIFSFKLGTFMKILEEKGMETNFDLMRKNYSALPKISLDYEVVEKLSQIIVTEYKGTWKDLGTWNTLSEEMGNSILGQGLLDDESINTHIVNELEIPVVVLGCSNLVVAASPDGVLVTEKSASPKLKEIIKEIDGRPMFVERRWGWYRVLDYVSYPDETEVITKRVHINKGKNLSYHYHKYRTEVWSVLSGKGHLILDGEYKTIQSGDVINIPAGAVHSIYSEEELEFIEIQKGQTIGEDDVYRLLMEWEEIINNIQVSKL